MPITNEWYILSPLKIGSTIPYSGVAVWTYQQDWKIINTKNHPVEQLKIPARRLRWWCSSLEIAQDQKWDWTASRAVVSSFVENFRQLRPQIVHPIAGLYPGFPIMITSRWGYGCGHMHVETYGYLGPTHWSQKSSQKRISYDSLHRPESFVNNRDSW